MQATPITAEEKAIEQDCYQRLKRLKTLVDNELITQEDFETRKSQIVDELTKTTGTSTNARKRSTMANASSSFGDTPPRPSQQMSGDRMNIVLADQMGPPNVVNNQRRKRKKRKELEVIKHPPPDWDKIRPEKAERHTYSYEKEAWNPPQKVMVKVDEVPFDKGGLRYVFHLQMEDEPGKKYVAKMSQDMRDNVKQNIYFNDVRMQAIARHFCHGPQGFNSYDPPKKVDFLEAFVLHLQQREGSPVCHVERYIEGTYKKYNNNVGWVSEDERNTPQAFAHFTYEASKGKLLVCDIQGVGDVYTDPQVHSSENLKAFGRGNLGTKGFENFLRTHRCNQVCRWLQLSNINQLPYKNTGTVPASTRIAGGISTVPYPRMDDGHEPLLSDFPRMREVPEESKSPGSGDQESTSCFCCLL